MAYTCDKSPGGDKLSIAGCDEHGGIVLVAQLANGKNAVPVCVAPQDLEEVISEMRAWSRASQPVAPPLPEPCPRCGGTGSPHVAACDPG